MEATGGALDVTQKLGASASAPALGRTLGNSAKALEIAQGGASSSRKKPGPAFEAPVDVKQQSAPHPYLKQMFNVGMSGNKRITYTLSQKIFHDSVVPANVRALKQEVQHFKKANILGTEQAAWNHSSRPEAVLPKHRTVADQKRKLLEIRSGLKDEKVQQRCKMHSDEQVQEMRRYLVGITGRGQIGAYSNKWFNSVDERGLCNHVREDWPDWNHSTSHHTKEDNKQAAGRFHDREERRMRMGTTKKLDQEDERHQQLKRDISKCTNPVEKQRLIELKRKHVENRAYVNPTEGTSNINALLREKKIDYQELKEQFKRELKQEYPEASEERLQAVAQRLLSEKLLADEKACRFPANHESFKPNLMVTTQDRRYKVKFHPGTYAYNEMEKRNCWSCCGNYTEESVGCEYKIVNPDAWCTLGFERNPGMAAAARH
jgi:hypothetical protein